MGVCNAVQYVRIADNKGALTITTMKWLMKITFPTFLDKRAYHSQIIKDVKMNSRREELNQGTIGGVACGPHASV